MATTQSTRTGHGKASGKARPSRPAAGGHQGHVEILLECAKTCNETFNYCIEQGGGHVEADHLRTMLDCAQVCALGADLMGRDSRISDGYMQVCAAACKACEESCEEFADDRTMQKCADVCRECYETCSQG